MATKYNTSSSFTDLSKLMSQQEPLQILNTARNQTDNQSVLNFVNEFLDVIDSNLSTPRNYKEHVYGQKDSFVRPKLLSRLELVASRILEKKAMACSTLSLDEQNFFQEELNFFVDLYFILVTTLIDLAAIKKEDLLPASEYDTLFDVVKEHLDSMYDFDELSTLFDELIERKDDYPDSPLLQGRIEELIVQSSLSEGGFVFAPSKSISNYNTGDILISVHEDAGIDTIEIGNLPNGLELDELSGNIFVQSPADLKAGKYNVLVRSADELGGLSLHHLELQIGGIEIPKYVVAPFRVIQDYINGDVLAKPTFTEDVIPIVAAEWEQNDFDVPTGVTLQLETGFILVEDEDMLEVGVHPVAVILTNELGAQSRHEFILSFKQDRKAVYTFDSPKAIGQYKSGDVVASVSDLDGAIIGVRNNKLPKGLILDLTGTIAVDDPMDLSPGTFQFNILAKNELNFISVKTLFITINPAQNPFYYDTSGTKPIDDTMVDDHVAKFKSHDGTAVSKVRLLKGDLPEGTTLLSNGNIVAVDPTKMKVGNYDIRVMAFVDGIDPGSLPNEESTLAEKEQELMDSKTLLENDTLNRMNALSTFTEFTANSESAIKVREDEIASIESQMQTATGNELESLTLLLQIKQGELFVIVEQISVDASLQQDEIVLLETNIAQYEAQIAQLEIDIKSGQSSVLKLKHNRWIQYEVNVVITLEEDNPSAWHLEIPKDWDDYTNNEIVARIVDCDGYEDIEIISGVLPSGMLMNQLHGTVEVSDASAVVAGEFILKTRSTDEGNGTTDHRLAIIIGGESTNVGEDYVVLPAKPANNYIDEEILGYPYNAAYSIVSARLSKGLLPNGVRIDTETGAMIVENSDLLKAGVYKGIFIKTTNSSGGTNYHSITLFFGANTLFTITTEGPKPITDYLSQENLVTVTLNSGTLQGIQVVNGELPPGTILYSSSGTLAVLNTNELVAGDYQFNLLMVESNGASDQQIVDLTIGPGGTDPGGGTKDTVIWQITNPIEKGKIKDGVTVASPSLLGYAIVNAISSTVPTNFSLASDGAIRVVSATKLIAGTYNVLIDIVDSLGRVFKEDIDLVVTDATTPPTTIVAVIPSPRDFHLLKNGELLARLSPEKEVSGVKLLDGTIPVGSVLNGLLGRVKISNRVQLGRGLTSAVFAVQTGGGSTSTIASAMLFKSVATASIAQNVNVDIRILPIPNFRVEKETAKFLLGMGQRLIDFQAAYLVTDSLLKALEPFYTGVTNFQKWMEQKLTDPTGNKAVRAGEYDSAYVKMYLKLVSIFENGLEVSANVTEADTFINLYNELFVSMVAMSLYRDKDISNLSTSPIAKLYELMSGNISKMNAKSDAKFIRENASMMMNYIPSTMPNLLKRFTILGT